MNMSCLFRATIKKINNNPVAKIYWFQTDFRVLPGFLSLINTFEQPHPLNILGNLSANVFQFSSVKLKYQSKLCKIWCQQRQMAINQNTRVYPGFCCHFPILDSH